MYTDRLYKPKAPEFNIYIQLLFALLVFVSDRTSGMMRFSRDSGLRRQVAPVERYDFHGIDKAR